MVVVGMSDSFQNYSSGGSKTSNQAICSVLSVFLFLSSKWPLNFSLSIIQQMCDEPTVKAWHSARKARCASVLAHNAYSLIWETKTNKYPS